MREGDTCGARSVRCRTALLVSQVALTLTLLGGASSARADTGANVTERAADEESAEPAEPAVQEVSPLVYLAQYGVACGVPMVTGLVAAIPIVGWIAYAFGAPALTGWLVHLVGEAMMGQETSTIPSIIGAYLGQFCIVPACVLSGVGVFLALSSAGLVNFTINASSGGFNPLDLGFWLGLGAAGYIAMMTGIFGGLAVSAVLPVAAYHLFAVEKTDGADDVKPATQRPVEVGAGRTRAARPCAY